ncbi:MAG: flagellar hook-length control protein FliK, partial [Stellaceae bacterium]
AAAFPAGAAPAGTASVAANAANAPASGTTGHQPQPGTAATDAAPATGSPASTVVLATLATADRDPKQASTNGGAVAPLGATGTGGLGVTPGVEAANLVPLAMSGGQAAPAATTGPVNVVASNGTNQPLASALGTQILSMVAAGRNQVTVHLSPPDLGNLTVHVEVQSRDVSAWFASPLPQVQQAVNDALAQLHGSLSGAGLNLSGAWVGADVSGGGNGRPAAAPLPVRRAASTVSPVEATAGSTTSVEGLSVYV